MVVVSIEIFKSAFLAGLLPVVTAPFLWSFVVYFAQGRSSEVNVEILIYSLIPVALFALIGGLAAAVLIGFPVLVVLSALNLNSTQFASVLGALLACCVLGLFGPSDDHVSNIELWPVYLFFSLLRAGSGALGSFLSYK